jgi:cysteinyl-tRNA synthetase
MITINGKKMGKSYNNVIKLTELFSGNHPLLEKAYHPMTIRMFILQSHYRGTLDFGNEALEGSEKALKRLWEAYSWLADIRLPLAVEKNATDQLLDEKVKELIGAFEESMNDDLNTAKVLANMFELVPIINGLKDKHISIDALSTSTIILLQQQMKVYIEEVLGLKAVSETDNSKLGEVMQLLIDLRKEAKTKKDFVTSDKIRNQLANIGIQLKDEKDGGMSYNL